MEPPSLADTAEPGTPHPRVSWGPQAALLAIVGALTLILASLAVSALITSRLDHPVVPEDVGDSFARASEILRYADRRLEAATDGEPLPRPPALFGDIVAARVFYATATLSTLGLAAVALAASRESPGRFARRLGLHRFERRWLWQAFLLMVTAYVGVFAYSVLADALGAEILVPDEQTPRSALRDATAFILFGFLAVVAAPVGEEFLFRGAVFGGLTRFGFWPAALLSGFVFSLSHVDPGTYIPFTGIGVLFAAQFWRSGSLWPSVLCHGYFNATSFALLALTR